MIVVVISIVCLITFANRTTACSRYAPFSFDELFVADVIVVATAEQYVGTPDLSTMTTGTPDTEVEFKVKEILRGKDVGSTIRLKGYLGDKDDFNDLTVPYMFVRMNGRSGSCFANTYRKGADFLLFLKKTNQDYTPNISALGPTNEELKGSDDLWLAWAKNEIKKRVKG